MTVLEVTCTDHGTVVADRTVATSIDGVHVHVTDESMRVNTLLLVALDGHAANFGPVGDDRVHGTARMVLTTAPGQLRVACGSDTSRHDDAVLVRVVDPADNWRPRQTLQDVGCNPSGSLYGGLIGTGETEQATLDAMLASSDLETGELSIQRLAGGYWRLPGHRFVVLRDGRAWMDGSIDIVEDGSWYATATGTCLWKAT